MPSSQLRAWRSAESRVDRAQDTTVRPRRLGHTDRSRHELLAQRSAHIIDPPRSQVCKHSAAAGREGEGQFLLCSLSDLLM